MLDPQTPTEFFQTRMNVTPLNDQYVVTADGQKFLLIEPIEGTKSSPITVIVNWPELLKK